MIIVVTSIIHGMYTFWQRTIYWELVITGKWIRITYKQIMDTFETGNILYILKYAIYLWYLATVIEVLRHTLAPFEVYYRLVTWTHFSH